MSPGHLRRDSFARIGFRAPRKPAGSKAVARGPGARSTQGRDHKGPEAPAGRRSSQAVGTFFYWQMLSAWSSGEKGPAGTRAPGHLAQPLSPQPCLQSGGHFLPQHNLIIRREHCEQSWGAGGSGLFRVLEWNAQMSRWTCPPPGTGGDSPGPVVRSLEEAARPGSGTLDGGAPGVLAPGGGAARGGSGAAAGGRSGAGRAVEAGWVRGPGMVAQNKGALQVLTLSPCRWCRWCRASSVRPRPTGSTRGGPAAHGHVQVSFLGLKSR